MNTIVCVNFMKNMTNSAKFLDCFEALDPLSLHALLLSKGWSVTMLATELRMTRNGLSKVINHVNRPRVWDIAFSALPSLPKQHRPRTRRRLLKQGRGYRYRDYFTIGALVTAQIDVGSMAMENQRGVVLSVRDEANLQIYGVLFETGQCEFFRPDDIDKYLVNAGLDCPGAMHYVFEDTAQVTRDYEKRTFNFYP